VLNKLNKLSARSSVALIFVSFSFVACQGHFFVQFFQEKFKMFPFNFQFSGNNSRFFFDQNVVHVMFMFFGCYGRQSLPLLSQQGQVGSQTEFQLILVLFNFAEILT